MYIYIHTYIHTYIHAYNISMHTHKYNIYAYILYYIVKLMYYTAPTCL